MPERQIEYEIVGDDKSGSRTFRKVGDEAEKAGLKVKKAAADFKESSKDADKSGSMFEAAGKRLRRAFGDGIIMAGRMSARIAGLTPLLGAAVVQLGKMAVAGYQLGVQLAPAVAILPTLAAHALYLKGVIGAVAPVMAKSLIPLATAWKAAAEHAGELGSEGLPTLAREFEKVNFPAISESMDRIAVSTGLAAGWVLKWANSAPGVKAIADFTAASARATEQLAPVAARVAISFANMVTRLTDPALRTGVGFLAGTGNKLIEIMDAVSRSDVENALATFSRGAENARNGIDRLGDAFKFLMRHEATIKRVGDAMAVFGIVVGIMTGTWLPAIAGAAHLAFGHWDQFSGAVSSVRDRLGKLAANPKVQQFLADLKEQFLALKRAAGDMLKSIGPDLQAFFDELGPTIRDIAPVVRALIPVFGAFAQSAIVAVGLVIKTFILVGRAAMLQMRIVAGAIKTIAPVFLNVVGTIINAAARAFGWVPGIGPKLRRAATEFNKFKTSVNNALNGIRRNITVQVNANLAVHYGGSTSAPVRMTYRTGSGGKASNLARAGGGPMIPGSAYVAGEQGRELIVPRVPSRALSASETARASTAGPTNHYHVYVTGAVVGDMRMLGQYIANALRSAKSVGLIPASAAL